MNKFLSRHPSLILFVAIVFNLLSAVIVTEGWIRVLNLIAAGVCAFVFVKYNLK